MDFRSHPTWVRGLKQAMCTNPLTIQKSHPTWVRGLKLVTSKALLPSSWSHPTWVRGLKHARLLTVPCGCVAPYVGAWIETLR